MKEPFIPGVFNKISREVFEQQEQPVIYSQPEEFEIPKAVKDYSIYLWLVPVLIIMLCGLGSLLYWMLDTAAYRFYS